MTFEYNIVDYYTYTDNNLVETDGPAGLLQGSTSLSSGQSKVGRINSPASLDFQDNFLARPSSQFKGN